ncbi:hypothetical protein D3C73_882570 [compost metagenome]
MNIAISRHQRAAAIILIHFPITEHVRALHKLFDQLHAAFIIRGQIIAIREMEGIDIILSRGVALVDNIQSRLISG